MGLGGEKEDALLMLEVPAFQILPGLQITVVRRLLGKGLGCALNGILDCNSAGFMLVSGFLRMLGTTLTNLAEGKNGGQASSCLFQIWHRLMLSFEAMLLNLGDFKMDGFFTPRIP